MRKNIDIKEKDVIPLKILAAKCGKDLKNYIQDLLSDHVKNQKRSYCGGFKTNYTRTELCVGSGDIKH